MSSARVLLQLAGDVALLLWSVKLVTAGVQSAFGATLRTWLGQGRGNRLQAMLAGLVVTALLQSSTATALMASAFASAGLIGLVPALAVMLGANVGTTLVVQVVSFDIAAVSPVLVLIGVVLAAKSRGAVLRECGRAVIGLGLMLLALQMLVENLQPLEVSDGLRVLMGLVTRDHFVTLALAILLGWAAHSSVAIVIFVMSLAAAGVVTPEASLVMVLGANIGTALNPVVAEWGAEPARLRLPLGNLANRLLGAAIALPFAAPVARLLVASGEPFARIPADFHVLFNLATALAFLAVLKPLASVLERLLPDRTEGRPGQPVYLGATPDPDPTVAISDAARETMRMVDTVEAMIAGSRAVFRDDDRERIGAVSRMDDVLDRLNTAIQHHMAAIPQDGLGEDERRRVDEILSLAINLEHIGDIIDKNVMELARKRLRNQMRLPPETVAAIDAMHARLAEHLRLAMAVFMFADADAARRLVAEKEGFRDLEQAVRDRHMALMRNGETFLLPVSALELDLTRDLKRIEAHIAATAHGVLERSGELRSSRLRSV